MERIVVGVDGSEGARNALRWAVRQAEVTGARVEAVLVYPYADVVALHDAAPPIPRTAPEELHDEAMEKLRRVVGSVDAGDGEVEIQLRVVQGRPADRLLAVAHGADLVVVGTRGLGGFRGLLLGSVSHQLVSHAVTPVVVVPETAPFSADAEAML